MGGDAGGLRAARAARSAPRASAADARSPIGPSCGDPTPARNRSDGILPPMACSTRSADRAARAPACGPGLEPVTRTSTTARAIRDRYQVPPVAVTACIASCPAVSRIPYRWTSSGSASSRSSASIRTATCQPPTGTPSCLARSSRSSLIASSDISSSASSSLRERTGSSWALLARSRTRAAASAAVCRTSRAPVAKSPYACGAARYPIGRLADHDRHADLVRIRVAGLSLTPGAHRGRRVRGLPVGGRTGLARGEGTELDRGPERGADRGAQLVDVRASLLGSAGPHPAPAGRGPARGPRRPRSRAGEPAPAR